MRKQLKEASGLFTRGREILIGVSNDERVPENIRNKAVKIVSAIEIDIAELDKMREHK